ncbi:MAG: hypothetical protein C0504_12760 [Candidatus Solibacter sp.]|nr:hypothetical protein [Candidatus Solibacter sp.]
MTSDTASSAVLTRGNVLGMSSGASTLFLLSFAQLFEELRAGAPGGCIRGPMADRFGARRVNMSAFFHPGGLLSYAVLALGGFVLLFALPLSVVVRPEFVPSQAGVVSALMMGFAWGTAGMVFIPLTGWISDQTPLGFAPRLPLVFPLPGLWAPSRIPRETVR